MGPEQMVRSFVMRSAKADGALIEANRGLYDGVDASGSYSSAVPCQTPAMPGCSGRGRHKSDAHGRSHGAWVSEDSDPEVKLGAVILNQVAGSAMRRCFANRSRSAAGSRSWGWFPGRSRNFFPERHLGLVPPEESEDISGALDLAAAKMSEYLDIEALWKLASAAPAIGCPQPACA